MALLISMGYGDTDTATRRRTARNITLSKPSYTEQSEGKRGSSVSRNGNGLLESYFTCSGTTNFGACVDAVLLFLHTCLRTTSFFVNEMSSNRLWMHSSIYLNSIPYVRLTYYQCFHPYIQSWQSPYYSFKVVLPVAWQSGDQPFSIWFVWH